MYHPTTRLLTILEMLQAHPSMSGAELARRLEVEPRSVRRYVMMLQDMGIPIEGARGPGGGYRLRPGFKLPPLLFSEDEATVLLLGLLGASWLEVDLPSLAVEGALAKIYRVLPLQSRERLQAISKNMILSPHPNESRPDASLLVDVSDAVQQHRRIAITYSSYHNEGTQREVEPYGVLGWKGHWYIVGYCCLRKDYRSFRLDRVTSLRVLSETFQRDERFDYEEYVRRMSTIPARWQIEIEFQAPLYLVQRKIPASHGSFSELPEGALWHTHHVHLAEMARYLVGLDLPFIIRHPPELGEALRELGEQVLRIAAASQPTVHDPPSP